MGSASIPAATRGSGAILVGCWCGRLSVTAGAKWCHRTRSSSKLQDGGGSWQNRGWRWASLSSLACFPHKEGSCGSLVPPRTPAQGCLPWPGCAGDLEGGAALFPGAAGKRMSCCGALLEGRDEEGEEEGKQHWARGSVAAEPAQGGSPVPWGGTWAPHGCPFTGTALSHGWTPRGLWSLGPPASQVPSAHPLVS